MIVGVAAFKFKDNRLAETEGSELDGRSDVVPPISGKLCFRFVLRCVDLSVDLERSCFEAARELPPPPLAVFPPLDRRLSLLVLLVSVVMAD